MKKREVILVIDEGLEEAREKISLVYSILQHRRRHRDYSVLPEVASHETTLARCRNLQPFFVFMARGIILKKKFGNLGSEVKKVCPKDARVFLFNNQSDLIELINREVKTKSLLSQNYQVNFVADQTGSRH